MNRPLIRGKLANRQNYGGERRATDIKYLVYHYTGNHNDRAESNARYFEKNIVKSSAHYFVDDSEIWQSVPVLCSAWAVGGKKYVNSAGGSMYGVVTNSNSISIEMCGTGEKKNGPTSSEKTIENAIELGRWLMQEYNIPIENVYRHYDVSGKLCPAWAVDETVWKNFKERLDDDMDIDKLIKNMTPAQTVDLVNKIQSVLSTQAQAPGTVNDLINAAVSDGITDGKRPKAFATRGEVAAMIEKHVKSGK